MAFYKRLPSEIRYMILNQLLSYDLLPRERIHNMTALGLGLSDETLTPSADFTAAVRAGLKPDKGDRSTRLESFPLSMRWDTLSDYLTKDFLMYFSRVVLMLALNGAGYATDPVTHSDIDYALDRHEQWLYVGHDEAIKKQKTREGLVIGDLIESGVLHNDEDCEDLMRLMRLIYFDLQYLEEELQIEVWLAKFLLLLRRRCSCADGAEMCEWPWRVPQ